MTRPIAEIEIAVTVKRETEKALLIDDGTREVWIPKSMITDQTGDGLLITSIFLPEWFATEKGLT